MGVRDYNIVYQNFIESDRFISRIHPIYGMNRIYPIRKIYKHERTILVMPKKRVDVTIDSDVHEIIEDIRSKEKFKPSFSQVVNSLLKEHPEIKKILNKLKKRK